MHAPHSPLRRATDPRIITNNSEEHCRFQSYWVEYLTKLLRHLQYRIWKEFVYSLGCADEWSIPACKRFYPPLHEQL